MFTGESQLMDNDPGLKKSTPTAILSRMEGAVFLDRDGVINYCPPGSFVTKWEEFEFLPEVLEALRKLNRAGMRCVVVTNQSCISRGICTAEAVEEIHSRMLEEIERSGGKIERVYYCPHREEDGCECRKPKPGMLLRARRELGLPLEGSFLVGDSRRDIEAGRSVGCRTVLITEDAECTADFVAPDLHSAVERIILRARLISP